jgi:hypothetical protein
VMMDIRFSVVAGLDAASAAEHAAYRPAGRREKQRRR